MSESLPVELNRGSVHAIEAPETFTTDSPFHLELRNEGGAVHIHVHLSDALAQAARIEEVNHYVEGDETVRVPVGTVPERGATGYLEIVSGYGTERERVEVTISSTPAPDQTDRGTTDLDHETDSSGRTTPGTAETEHTLDPSDRETPEVAPSSRGDGAGTATDSAGPRSSSRRSRAQSEEAASTTKATGAKTETSAQTPTGSVRGDTGDRAEVRSLAADPSREAVAFAVLAAVAVVVGITVILVVQDLVRSLVIAGVVTAAVAAVGWLLFE